MVIGYLLVAGIVRLVRRDERPVVPDWVARVIPFVAGLTAVTSWASVLLISKLNNQLSHTNRMLLHFGLPRESPYVLALAILVPAFIALTVGLIILLVLAGKRSGRFSWRLVFFMLVAVAAVLYSGLMVRWDLHLLLFT